jgi:hypothetical protein
MRSGLIAVAVLLISGCGDDNNVASADLSAVRADMATGGRDMAAMAKTGCSGLRTCANGCSGQASCITACQKAATSAAVDLWNAYQMCASNDCEMALDGGVMRCDPNATTVTADCNTCFNNSLHGGATGIACNPVNDPNCGHCSAALKACLDSTP